jgi:uncharacterized membrane protein
MTTRVILFADIVLAGIVSGIVLGIFFGYNPATLSAHTYVEQQQNVIRSLNVLMPALGLFAIVLTITLAVRLRYNKPVLWTLVAAAGLLIFSGAVTRFGNQPINAIVIEWDLNAIPDTWTDLRDTWWKYHTWRAAASFLAFCCIASTALRRDIFRD